MTRQDTTNDILQRITDSMLPDFKTPYEINNGGCEEWAELVLAELRHSTNMVGRWATDVDHASCSHIFIEIDGKFYDAECLDGVINYMQLPLFARWQQRHPGQVVPVQLEDFNEAYDLQGRPTRLGISPEQLRTRTMDENTHAYALQIDGPLLAKQRQWLLDLVEKTTGGDREHLEGVIALLDEIADQAHDRHGIDCLLEADGSESAAR